MSQLPTTQEDEAQTPSNEQCGATAVGDYVEFLQDLPDIPVNTPSEIEQLAQLYDESQTLPNKEQHAPFFLGAHPEFVPYMKALIFQTWDAKQGKIRINQVFRSPTEYNRLLNAHLRDPANNAKPAKNSYHLYGLAMDFNLFLGGKVYGKSRRGGNITDKSLWEATGVPAIGQSMNLQWGGTFRTNYDPIHFDFEPVLRDLGLTDPPKELKALVEEQNLRPAPNRVTLPVLA